MLFKWMIDRMGDVKYKGPIFDLDAKELPAIDPKTMKSIDGKKVQHPAWKYKKKVFEYICRAERERKRQHFRRKKPYSRIHVLH